MTIAEGAVGHGPITGAFSSGTTLSSLDLYAELRALKKIVCWHLLETVISFLFYSGPATGHSIFLEPVDVPPALCIYFRCLGNRPVEVRSIIYTNMQLGLRFATPSVISCYSYGVRN